MQPRRVCIVSDSGAPLRARAAPSSPVVSDSGAPLRARAALDLVAPALLPPMKCELVRATVSWSEALPGLCEVLLPEALREWNLSMHSRRGPASCSRGGYA